MRWLTSQLVVLASALVSAQALGQVSVTTQHNNNFRTGANLAETKLNSSNVRPGSFGKLFTRQVDGQLYAQPLYIPGLTIGGKKRNVVFCATMHDSIYAFDANDPAASAPLWKKSYINEPSVTTIPYYHLVGWTDIEPEIGIVATPVIDPATNTMFAVVRTLEGSPDVDSNYKQRLHAIDILTGNERPGSPVEITGTYPGNGDSSNGAGLNVYNPRRQNQRPAITLHNGNLYIASASHGDQRPYHGWILTYNASTLQFVSAFNTTANGGLGGIWQSGQGPLIDGDGNLYVMTGNAPYDPTIGNYGNSVIKLSTPNLTVIDHFTPFNQEDLDRYDEDLGSCGPMLVPGTNSIFAGSKHGKLFVLDRNNLGKFQTGSDSHAKQAFYAFGGHLHGSPVFYDGPLGRIVYAWSENDRLKAFRMTAQDTVEETPAATGAVVAPGGMPGAMLSISANGKTANSGVVWASLPLSGNANQSIVPGVLRAFDATTLEEIWNSRGTDGDNVGKFAKYAPPTIADGQVFLGTFSNELAIYGLLPQTPPEAPKNLQALPAERRIVLSWTAGARARSYDIWRAPEGGRPTTYRSSFPGTTFSDTNAAPGVRYSYWVRSRNNWGPSRAIGPVTASSVVGTTSETFGAIADSFVMSGTGQNMTYGKKGMIYLDSNTPTTTRYGYMKFDLKKLSIGQVLQAKVRLYGSHWGEKKSKVWLYSILDHSWSEEALNWLNKPRFEQALGFTEVGSGEKYYEWDVTDYVKAIQAAGGDVQLADFALMTEPKTKDEPLFYNGRRIEDRFNTREASRNKPELIVTTRPAINYPDGFAAATNLQLNGTAAVVDSRIVLTETQNWQAGSVFSTVPVQVNQFQSKFRIWMQDPVADGMMFVIQGQGPTALGPSGGGLGYASDQPNGGVGITPSVGIKFDIWNNAGEGESSTGVYVDGASPTVPAENLDGTNINLRSGNVFEVNVTYDGTVLRWTILDTRSGQIRGFSRVLDIPATMGSSLGYVGFTGATGGASARLQVLSWVYKL